MLKKLAAFFNFALLVAAFSAAAYLRYRNVELSQVLDTFQHFARESLIGAGVFLLSTFFVATAVLLEDNAPNPEPQSAGTSGQHQPSPASGSGTGTLETPVAEAPKPVEKPSPEPSTPPPPAPEIPAVAEAPTPAVESAPAPQTPEPAAAPVPAAAPQPWPPAAAYQILYMLQKEGRLLDFLMEDITGCDDETLGGAIRPIYEGCRKILQDRLIIEPVIQDAEGSELKIDTVLDPHTVKLTGNVPPQPPFQGTVVHRGWRLKEYHMPELVSGWTGDIILPAEIEIR